MKLTLLLVLLFSVTTLLCEAQEQRFFDWAKMTFPAAEYANRRQALVSQLREGGGGVFLAPSGPSVRGETFRQLDDFLYFTGLELPQSILAIDADAGETRVFAPRRDSRFERPSRINDFPGRPLADDPAIASESGISRIEPFENVEAYLAELIHGGKSVWIDFHNAAEGSVRVEPEILQTMDAEHTLAYWIQEVFPGFRALNAYPALARLRMVKSAAEIATMRRAAEISARALLEAAGHVGEGVDERTLEAAFEAGCKRGGAQRLAFPSIFKSGPNSLWPWRILASHYDRRNRPMQTGDLVIFDVGCELDHYASDMGRTFPISGRFTEEQRALLRWVTVVADSIIATVRPGVTFRQLTEAAIRQIPPDQRQYMQTGLYFGHHIGLSSGDPSIADAELEPGMIFTVEPWYYNHDAEVAVFVEDEVLVTETGAEVLTTILPRTPEELERLVGSEIR